MVYGDLKLRVLGEGFLELLKILAEVQTLFYNQETNVKSRHWLHYILL